jgi:hypothetical protein
MGGYSTEQQRQYMREYYTGEKKNIMMGRRILLYCRTHHTYPLAKTIAKYSAVLTPEVLRELQRKQNEFYMNKINNDDTNSDSSTS